MRIDTRVPGSSRSIFCASTRVCCALDTVHKTVQCDAKLYACPSFRRRLLLTDVATTGSSETCVDMFVCSEVNDKHPLELEKHSVAARS